MHLSHENLIFCQNILLFPLHEFFSASYLFYRTLVQSGMGLVALLAGDESFNDGKAAMSVRRWIRYD